MCPHGVDACMRGVHIVCDVSINGFPFAVSVSAFFPFHNIHFLLKMLFKLDTVQQNKSKCEQIDSGCPVKKK